MVEFQNFKYTRTLGKVKTRTKMAQVIKSI